jgi:hypothetical protein
VPPAPGREQLARDLAELLDTMSVESMFYLRQALEASKIEKAGGTLLINIPRKVGEYAQVRWAGGSHESFLRL